MRLLKIILLCISFSVLEGQGAQAQMSNCPPLCYPLNSEEAAGFLQSSQSPLYDRLFKWVPERIGQGFTCLDYCPLGELEVSPGVFCDEKCTYTVTNTAEADMIGRVTHIVLRRIPAEANDGNQMCLHNR